MALAVIHKCPFCSKKGTVKIITKSYQTTSFNTGNILVYKCRACQEEFHTMESMELALTNIKKR